MITRGKDETPVTDVEGDNINLQRNMLSFWHSAVGVYELSNTSRLGHAIQL